MIHFNISFAILFYFLHLVILEINLLAAPLSHRKCEFDNRNNDLIGHL